MSYGDERRTYGLSGDQAEDIARLDDERRARAVNATGRLHVATDASPRYDRAGTALGCGLMLLLLLAAAFALVTSLDGEQEHGAPLASPVVELDVQERRLEALATRVTELEIRIQRSADAAAGFAPIGPAVTSTPVWTYNGPLSRAVSPPDGMPPFNPTAVAVGGPR